MVKSRFRRFFTPRPARKGPAMTSPTPLAPVIAARAEKVAPLPRHWTCSPAPPPRSAPGDSVVHMEVGQPSAPAPRAVREAAMAALEVGRYRLYRRRWASRPCASASPRHYREAYGVEVSPSRVVVTTGSSAGVSCSPSSPKFRARATRVGDHRAGLPGLSQTFLEAFSARARDDSRSRRPSGYVMTGAAGAGGRANAEPRRCKGRARDEPGEPVGHE